MMDGTQLPGCTGEGCRWLVTGNSQVRCVDGDISCVGARLLPAAVSAFHDQALAALTQQINALLAAVPADPAGRKLSFLHTRQGTLLAWVQHEGGDVAAEAITAASDNAAVAQALGLLL